MYHLWSAFGELSESRTENHPIKNTEIEAWLNIHCVYDTWTRKDYYKVIRALDRVWRKRINDGNSSDRN
jgi:hypothetical protein